MKTISRMEMSLEIKTTSKMKFDCHNEDDLINEESLKIKRTFKTTFKYKNDFINKDDLHIAGMQTVLEIFIFAEFYGRPYLPIHVSAL